MTRASFIILVLLLAAPVALAGPPPAGWKAEGAVKTFDQKSVWKAINGAAELYLSYGFSRLDVHRISKGEQTLALHVYTLGTPLDAMGVFLRERPEEAVPLKDAGTMAAFASPGHCLAFGGGTYLRVQISAGTLTKAVCNQILTHAARSVITTKESPGQLRLLPVKGRLPGSLGYTRQSFLGLRELSGCLHARYGTKKKSHIRFIVLAPDDQAIEKVRARLLKKKWTAGRYGDRAVMFRTVPYKGVVAVARVKGGFIGVAGVGEQAATLKLLGGM